MNKNAKHFLENEKEFHLGILPTEQPNPKTANLSDAAKHNTQNGIRMLQSVDLDMIPVIEKTLLGTEFNKLVSDIHKAMKNNRRLFLSGCGATGRLCILLEAAWRKYWQKLKTNSPAIVSKTGDYENMICSIMTGGDRALVRSVENFEDYQSFGRYQIAEAGITENDVLVAISEGGETSSVIGTIWEAIDKKAITFFVFNNPSEILSKHIKRSREVIQNGQTTILDLSSGPMAIAGSTRMQATTSELFVVGSAIELALTKFLTEEIENSKLSEIGLKNLSSREYITQFSSFLEQLGNPQNIEALANLTEYEKNIYSEGGLITYFSDDFLLDIFTDTTERAPTFTLPPFRKVDDLNLSESWSFVKNPTLPTKEAWKKVYRRNPKGLTWNSVVYKNMGASEKIQKNPPALDNNDIFKFNIGKEPSLSRYGKFNSAILLTANTNSIEMEAELNRLISATENCSKEFGNIKKIAIGNTTTMKENFADFTISYDLPDSPLELWTHLGIKLVLNTISTATMCMMERVLGNWMVCAEATNKKLIDRGTRIVSNFTGLSYDDSCHEFFETLNIIREQKDFVPPSAFAIYRILTQDKLKTPSLNMQDLLKELHKCVFTKGAF